MAKNLTSALISKEVKVLDEQMELKILSPVTKEEYKLKLDKKFRKTKVMNLVSELLVNIQESKKNEVEMESIFVPYLMLLIIKYFTSIGTDMPTDLGGQIALLNKLIDLELLGAIIESFEDGEVESVYETVTEALTKIEEDANALDDRIAAIEQQIEYERVTSQGNNDENNS